MGCCDLVDAQGVEGFRVRPATLGYRIAGRMRRGGSVSQTVSNTLHDLRAEVVRPDLSADELAAGWRGVSRWVRWLILVGAPVTVMELTQARSRLSWTVRPRPLV